MQQTSYVPINKSKLYHLGRKKDLASLLGVSLHELKDLTKDENFKEWPKKQKGKKDRIIEEALPTLASVLSKLLSIIGAVETPVWLLSGKKAIKPQDNAEVHRNSRYMVAVDIEQFYQSTKREFVYSSLKKFFGQTDDVASLLADLVTYKGHIPTGTATSQIMAFWAYRQTFERMYKLCSTKGIKMTVWVDDIVFSSMQPLPKNWVADIAKMAKEVSLSLKTKKTKRYSAAEFKTVTGSAISPSGELLVKNEKRKEILDLLKGKTIERLTLKEGRSIFGKLSSQRQNDPDFFSGLHLRCKAHVQKLEKRRRKKLVNK